MKIKNRLISKNSSPFIIAEISANHENSLKKVIRIMEIIAKSGADAIKFQTYTPDEMTLNVKKKDFLIKDQNSLWKGQNLYNLYKKGMTPGHWFKTLFKKANELGLIAFSSPFDIKSVDLLEKLNTPVYKLASFEIVHIPLIKKIAKTKKPMIISTGMASCKEIKEAISVAKRYGCREIALLKCTSTYPAKLKNSNLLTINDMKKRFRCEVGFSDHTIGLAAPISAICNGATIIEKHVTLRKNDKGLDSAFSIEARDFKNLVTQCRLAKESIGKVNYGPTKDEIKSLKFRRSIYVSGDIKRGETLTHKNIKVIRPSHGLHPRFYDKIIGRKVIKNLKMGEPFKLSFLKK
tara:strand:- start:468 stop:1514 length:1047 start_codon:yes stop_codon:yes gene_type:complete